MQIPKVIHQTYKSSKIPRKWKGLQEHNLNLHPDFTYYLWTDKEMDEWVSKEFPEFYPVFAGFQFHITRIDIFRYLLMYRIGGLYLDLDYELLAPFKSDSFVVLPKNRSKSFGDTNDEIGNCFFASVPGHVFWKDAIEDLKNHPPKIVNEYENNMAAGPGFLTRIYFSGSYPDVEAPERIVYHPPNPRSKAEYNAIIQNGQSLGIHHGWGSWKERYTWKYLRKKFLD